MNRYLTLSLCVVLGSTTLGAANKEQTRLENCGTVMQEVLDVPDNIPQELLEKAECVIVIPSMTKVAVGIGGSYGRGAMVCRTGKAFNGRGARPRCTRSRVAASACSSARNRLTSSCS
jgi:Uncharacterized conserved protein